MDYLQDFLHQYNQTKKTLSLESQQQLEEQYDELSALQDVELCSRNEESLVDLNSNLAQVVIGVRRSGKSTLCYNVLKQHAE